jgi:subtilisin family serine protease
MSGGVQAQAPRDRDHDHERSVSRSETTSPPGMDWLWDRDRAHAHYRPESRASSHNAYRAPHLRKDSEAGHSRARSQFDVRDCARSRREDRNMPHLRRCSALGRARHDHAYERAFPRRPGADQARTERDKPKPEHHKRMRPKRDTAKPDVETPDVAKPDTARTDVAKPDVPKSEVAKSERPKPAPTAPGPDYRPAQDAPASTPSTPTPVAQPPKEAAKPVEEPAADDAYPRLAAEKDVSLPEEARRASRQVLTLIRSNQETSVEAELAKTYRLDPTSGEAIPLLDARMQLYRIKDNRTVDQVVAELVADPRVMAVQPNFIYRHQAGEEPTGAAEAGKYDHAKLRLREAHQTAKGRGVLVAVIDSVIDGSHPDLAGAVASSFDAAGGKDVDNDAHGLAVAGVIRGAGPSLGSAPEAKLLAVRAFSARKETGGKDAAGKDAAARDSAGREPEATTQSLIRGVQWAVDHGAKILNLSFTGPEDPAFQSLLAMTRIHKVVAVAAAGNAGPTAGPAYPAAYPEVIAVTALDSNDQVYQEANHGRYIAVAAPGVEILAPAKRGGRALYTGSSFAAAEISGVLALLLEKKPDLDPTAAREALVRSAESFGPDADGNAATGAGLVNAAAALKALEE